ncbi:MAG: xanthine dehydrogenase family protein molybdopterin-binding subunit, partial [Alphaproteobacteria bacterium]|nr:xanthine dehydrogenase family protein molybdopterin-binding subunit [Alphaproteobacteria bacterium]
MLDYKPNIVLSNTDYKVLGTRPIRKDGLEKVTGRAQFAADIPFTGLLHGKILRSPHAHARIRSIDPSRALALPGVKAVVTSDDFAAVSDRLVDVGEGQLRNIGFLSANCLARGKVLYHGQAVAAVAATSPHIAEEALGLIDIDYETLPAVFSALDA